MKSDLMRAENGSSSVRRSQPLSHFTSLSLRDAPQQGKLVQGEKLRCSRCVNPLFDKKSSDVAVGVMNQVLEDLLLQDVR